MENKLSVAIVGAGISGIATAVILKRELEDKIDLVIYEKAGSVGGTWRDNTYPGAGSDSPVHLYSLSSHPNPSWTSTHVRQPEILAYLEDLVDSHSLHSNIKLNSKVRSASWDPSLDAYLIEWGDTLTGARSAATHHVIITGTGILPTPRMPEVPGAERFRGKMFHSSQWERGIDLRNKRVAVIGNGTSAAQLVPELAKIEGIQIVQFFRRANWHFPAAPLAINLSPENQERFRKHAWLLKTFRYALFLLHEALYPFIFGSDLLRSFTEMMSKKHVLKTAPEGYHSRLIPTYPMGCRRVVFDVSYLQSLHRNNINLVNQPVKRFTETGVVSLDGKHFDFDVIIAATGFDTLRAPFEVRNASGDTLQEYYDQKGGAEAYLGTLVPRFPNFFMIGGPNTLTGYLSYWFTVESQMNLIVPLLKRLRANAWDDYITSITVSQEASDKYNEKIQRRFKDSIWETLAARQYRDASSGKHIFLFPGPLTLFWWWTRSPRWSDLLLNGQAVQSRTPRRLFSLFTGLFLAAMLAWVIWMRVFESATPSA